MAIAPTDPPAEHPVHDRVDEQAESAEDQFADSEDQLKDSSDLRLAPSASPNDEDAARAERREKSKNRRIQRRRAQILSAAAQIMYRTGYHEMSMQAVAAEAGVSVGLIYQYFGNKHDLLQRVIIDILEDFQVLVPEAMDAAGAAPEARIRAGFDSFCRTIDRKRKGTLLAYRESQTLTSEGRRELLRLEDETLIPFRDAVSDGIAQGVFRDVSPFLVAHNLKIIAHAWALKHWDLADKVTLDEYIEYETDLVMASLKVPHVMNDAPTGRG